MAWLGRVRAPHGLAALLCPLALAFFAAQAASADEPEDTVFLSNGGRLRGTVIEQDPERGVKLRLLDGSIRKLKTGDVARIEYAADPDAAPAPPPEAPAAAPAPAPAPPPPPYSIPPPPPAPVPEAAKHVAFAGSVGAAYLPVASSGNGGTTAGFVEAAGVFRNRKSDVRVGGIVAYETTDYQSSTSALVTLRTDLYFGSGVYALGVGSALGYGSFSPKGGYNADDGGSAEVAVYAVPMLLALGPKHSFEINFEVGAIRLFAWNEVEPFYNLSIGFASW
jgi:hypothetical protein